MHSLYWEADVVLNLKKIFDCELNYQKIRRTLTHDSRKHWTVVSTLLGLISNVYRDLHLWRSNQRQQITEPKLYNWVTVHIEYAWR